MYNTMSESLNPISTASDKFESKARLKSLDRSKRYRSNVAVSNPGLLSVNLHPTTNPSTATVLLQDQSAHLNRSQVIPEIEHDDSPRAEDNMLTEKELLEINKQLREEVEMTLVTFE